jgi:GAF domain-containing protein
MIRRQAELEAKVADLDSLLGRAERTVKALRDVGLALGSTLDLDQLLELILRKIAELLEADRATLYLLDEQRQRLLSRIIIGDEAKSIELPWVGYRRPRREVWQTVRIKDAYRDRRFLVTGTRCRATARAIWLPMKNHGPHDRRDQVLNKQSSQGGRPDAGMSARPEADAPPTRRRHARRRVLAARRVAHRACNAGGSVDDNSRLFPVIQKHMQLVETKEQLEHRVADQSSCSSWRAR